MAAGVRAAMLLRMIADKRRCSLHLRPVMIRSAADGGAGLKKEGAPTDVMKDVTKIVSSVPLHDGERTKLLVLYTGGTMGMIPDLSSGALTPAPGYFTQHILKLEELKAPHMPDFDIREYDPLLDSSCMGPADWVKMAEDIESHYYTYHGFVIIMGTDTMAYAASALSFMLENLGKPVILTGSQIPFYEPYNDARRNLIISMIFASNDTFADVCVFFNDRLLRGNRASKVNAFGLTAFDSPNLPPLAVVGVNLELRSDLAMPPPKSAFRVHKNMDSHIIVLKLVPGFNDDAIFNIIRTDGLKAIIMEMYGTGNAPNKRTGLLSAVRLASEKGIVVVALTQCRQGGVVLGKYAVGSALREAGVVSGGDMTTEACATKLAYIIGRVADPVRVRELMSVDLRGELSGPERFAKSVYSVRTNGHLSKL